MKAEDEFARHPGDPEITEELTTSYLSGRTNQELAAAGDIRVDHAARGKIAKARKRLLPDPGKVDGRPQEAVAGVPGAEPRLALREAAERAQMDSRDQAQRLPLAGAHRRGFGPAPDPQRARLDASGSRASPPPSKKIGLASGLLDGEVVVEDPSGITSFNNLQSDLSAGRQDRFRYFVFDLLYCEGFDLTKAVLIDRKNLLQQILAGLPAGSPVRFSEHLEVDGPTMLEHSCRFGLEGIISKRKDQPYRSGPRRALAQVEVHRPAGIRAARLHSLERGQPLGGRAGARLSRGRRAHLCGAGRDRLVRRSGPLAARCARGDRRPRNRSSPISCRPAPRRACAGSRRGWSARSSFAAGPRTAAAGGVVQGIAGGQGGRRDRARERAEDLQAGGRARARAGPAHPSGAHSMAASPASPSKGSPSSTPRSPTGFCRT